MALPDVDTSVGHSFGLEFDGVMIKQITEVSGLKIDQDVVEFTQDPGSGTLLARKLPGRPKVGEVTLTRGLTHDDSFENWIRDSQFGKLPDARKGGAIIVFDDQGAAIKRYQLINARLKTLQRGTRKASNPNAVSEQLILTHEGCKAEGPGAV
jgi:phage tail-like protein